MLQQISLFESEDELSLINLIEKCKQTFSYYQNDIAYNLGFIDGLDRECTGVKKVYGKWYDYRNILLPNCYNMMRVYKKTTHKLNHGQTHNHCIINNELYEIIYTNYTDPNEPTQYKEC